MVLWPPSPTGVVDTYGVVSATSDPVAITTGVVNTKTSWTEMSASLTRSLDGFWVTIRSGGSNGLLDVGVGGSGSEQVIVSNLAFGPSRPSSWWMPMKVSALSRVAMRMQSSGSSISYTTQIIGGPAAGPFYGRSTTYGASTAASTGTALATSATANVKSGWTQIVSATTAPINYLLVLITGPSSASANIDGLVDIGVGGSGTEAAIVSDLAYRQLSTGFDGVPQIGSYVSVPTGTRLSARWQGDATTQSPRVSLIGFG